MASESHILQQHKEPVESGLKLLTNEELKKLCRLYRQPVSGNKAVLQQRATHVLDDVVRRGDTAAFEDLRKRADISGPSPVQRHPPSAMPNTNFGHPSHNMPPQRTGPTAQTRLPAGGKYFKSSPFYEVLEALLPLQDLPDMPQNRHTVRAVMTIKPDIAQQFRNGEPLRIFMYCGIAGTMSPFSQTEIAFPNQIEVKVNDQDVKSNFKGLKNKLGSTKPADITSFVKKYNGQPNTISVTYALTSKRYAYTAYLVRPVGVEQLVERIKTGNIIPREKVLRDMSKANADPDIEATSVRMSLKDPISTVRISLPVRSSHCTHNQCFDGRMFLELQEQAPQWNCPVCNKHVSFESLCVDKYFQDILQKTSTATEKVDVEPTGEWRVIKDEDDTNQPGASSKARASYDHDFDEDLVELDPPANKHLNGLPKEAESSSTLSGQSGATPLTFGTPPLSSREQSVAQSVVQTPGRGIKRPQSAVIDLTFSDEDDDPPRSAKRQNTSQLAGQQVSQNAQANGARNHESYHTPTSLPDPRNPYQSFGQSDNRRSVDADQTASTGEYDFSAPALNTWASTSGSGTFGQSRWPAPPARQSFSGLALPQNGSFSRFAASNSPFTARSPVQQVSNGSQQDDFRLAPIQTQRSSPGPQGFNSNSTNQYPDQGWRSDIDYSTWPRSPGEPG